MKSPIQTYREEMRLSQDELAKKLGCSQSLISLIEKGTRAITPENAIAWEPITGIHKAILCPRIFDLRRSA